MISAKGFAEELYYIYKDRNGRTHIEDSITEKHAKYGYRVVNSQGTTIQVVPSVREQKRKEEKRRKRSQKQIAKQAQREQDDFLLRSFVDINDIRQAGNKKIMALQTQIDTTMTHITAFEKNLEQLETQIEKADQENREITQKDVDAIAKIKDSIKNNKKFVQRKMEQQQEIRDEYIGYMRRFQELQAKK